MADIEAERSQLPGGESDLPAQNPSLKGAQDEVTEAIKSGAIQKENIIKDRAPVSGEIPHARERLILSGVAMVASIVATVSPYTPDNVRSGMLSIATIVVTALVKPFEKNG
jgi:hypothetical protein